MVRNFVTYTLIFQFSVKVMKVFAITNWDWTPSIKETVTQRPGFGFASGFSNLRRKFHYQGTAARTNTNITFYTCGFSYLFPLAKSVKLKRRMLFPWNPRAPIFSKVTTPRGTKRSCYRRPGGANYTLSRARRWNLKGGNARLYLKLGDDALSRGFLLWMPR